jgi:4-carboxymuconolactone decarboxylase
VAGPFGILLWSPEIARRAAHLGEHVRFGSALVPAEREIAILAVARALDCRYEWAAHAPLARKAGVREDAIAAVRERRAPAGLTPEEAQVVAYATRLLGAHRVEAGAFQALHRRLGERGIVELTATVGYYSLIACVLNAFEVDPEPGAEALPV